MPVAVGMYLPFGLSTPILLGGLIAYFIEKQNRTASNPEISLQNGILVSSGLIAGESLMGIILAFIAGAGIKSLNLGLDPILTTVATILSVFFFGIWFFKESKPEKVKSR
jgi:hypothetical protein